MIFAELPDSMTLGEAREWFLTHVHAGVKCPCCTQHAEVYRWTLYSTAVRTLISLYRLGGTSEFVHSRRAKKAGQGGDCTRLAFWGLVEHQKAKRDDGGRSGFWRVTDEGEAFLLEKVGIQKYAYVYAKQLLMRDGPTIMIRDVLGKTFDYDQMMTGQM